MSTDFLTGPYGQMLGVERHDPPVEHDSLLSVAFKHEIEGRPGFLHGGAIAGLLEIAAYEALARLMKKEGRDPDVQIKPINVTIEFMRGGLCEETYAAGRVTRLGRRIANVEAVAWQDSPDRQIAAAQMHFLIRSPREMEAKGLVSQG